MCLSDADGIKYFIDFVCITTTQVKSKTTNLQIINMDGDY